MSGAVVKRAYRYRFYPNDQQAVELSRTFGCVRLVYHRVLEARTTAWKQTVELAIVWSRSLPEGAMPSTVTVSRDPAGRWHVSILVETTVDPLPPRMAEIGVDAGLTSLSTLSAQRNLARKAKGSNNRDKARIRVARVYARIADRRRDLLHKVTTRLVRENQTIVIEDLAVRHMVKSRSLARAISGASWSEFRSMLTYEAEWYGRTVIAVNRWCPSCKTCARCGHLLDALPLELREWTCPGCGEVHDRDVNAARNILAAGRAVAACGDGVGPNRR